MRGRLGWLLAGVAWAAALLCPALVLAQDLQPVPALAARVTDTTATLSTAQREALDAKLAAFEGEAGTQIVVLIVATTKPEDIAEYAYRVADQWKVGRRDVGDGLLVLVAKDDRRVRIEVAKALEGAIPDLAARQIIDRAIRPAFKAGDYAGGLNAGVDQLAARVRGEALPAPQGGRSSGNGGTGGLGWDQLAMFFFVGVPIIGAVLTGVLGRKLGSLATGGAAGTLAWWFGGSLLLAGAAGVLALVMVGVLGIGAAGRRGLRGGHGGPPIIWGGGGGGGGGWGGGGGFSSGGGGDFGGGGASGDW
ncbi:TPM domain-containing protein [Ideonella sp.]|uniref:TPM domain-containing protein n=1 Tax=Ideonella sp. TaxID=1929293 RepID=UPI002B45FA69|nr:TPM domain-containing protein [Ideonella sp.]HJV70456.1 TPM domain-containing protein [Ideonella sp.]